MNEIGISAGIKLVLLSSRQSDYTILKPGGALDPILYIYAQTFLSNPYP